MLLTMRTLSLVAAFAAAYTASAYAQVEAPQPTDATLVKKIYSGTNVCKGLTDGSPCGSERWNMTVYEDGTRTIRTFLNSTDTASQITMVMRVDEDFKSIDAFSHGYSMGKFLGSGFYAVEGDKLKQTINTPDGVFVEELDVPENFSLLLHPVSADGWHYAYYDQKKLGQQTSQQCTLGAAGRSVMCAFSERMLEFVANETITVPAGTFDTHRFKFGDSTELWLMGPDRIIVQHEYGEGNSRYQLTEYEETASD